MTIKYLYMKLVGLLVVTLGFSYTITSFYNLFDIVFGNKIVTANTNVYIMGIGIIFPLFVFIFGIFFYLYADFNRNKKSLWIFVCTLLIFILGLLKILLSNSFLNNLPFNYILDFVHISFGYVAIGLGILLIYGRIKYKY